MKAIRLKWLVGFLYMCFLSLHAQETTVISPYLSVEGNGVLISQSKVDVENKTMIVYTLGRFVNLTESSLIPPQRIYKTYFKPNEAGFGAETNKKSTIQTDLNSQVFIDFSHDYFIEIYDGKSQRLLFKCQIKKVKKIPDIQLNRMDVNGVMEGQLLAYESNGTLTISPGESLLFNHADTNELNHLDLNYRLVNLNNKKIETQVGKTTFELNNLVPNTTYELRFNYVIQPESEGILYIKVAGKWYQSLLLYFLIVGLIMLCVFLAVRWFFSIKIRRSIKKQHTIEQAALRLQSLLNPHFTFNALSSIQGLINTGRIEDANIYLQEFSALLRQTLQRNQDVFISLDQELSMMRLYLRLEALRFNFSWSILKSKELEGLAIEVPTLILQPLLENSVKHGLSGLGEKGVLIVECKLGSSKTDLMISISDNGRWKENDSKEGYGIQLTEERMLTLNKLSKNQSIKLTYNLTSGTEVQILFKNWINFE